jgi:phosphopantothenoylcysteine synthetase/decarboxylase
MEQRTAMDASLAGRHILVTSGPTRAALDAVRYVSNRSSGRLGSRIAREALRRGAYVTFVAGAGSTTPGGSELGVEERARLNIVGIETVADLIAALERNIIASGPPDVVVHAMAVLDYVPEESEAVKRPSGEDAWEIQLVRTPKVIKMIRTWAPDALLVQFKLEVGLTERELMDVALSSLHENESDLVVANDLERIRDERHPALIISPDGEVIARPETKSEIAAGLCDLIAARLL